MTTCIGWTSATSSASDRLSCSSPPLSGKRVTFIHQEVYRDNESKKGLRPPLKAFHLETEPWVFAFNRNGRVAARLEGAFGINAFRSAVEAALR